MSTIEIDDRDAKDDQERRESRLLLDALRQRRAALGGEASVPDDKRLTETIMLEAQKRSAQISASRASTARLDVPGASIPVWVIIGWLLAIGGAVVAFLYLHR